jgi:hypothetical protein
LQLINHFFVRIQDSSTSAQICKLNQYEYRIHFWVRVEFINSESMTMISVAASIDLNGNDESPDRKRVKRYDDINGNDWSSDSDNEEEDINGGRCDDKGVADIDKNTDEEDEEANAGGTGFIVAPCGARELMIGKPREYWPPIIQSRFDEVSHQLSNECRFPTPVVRGISLAAAGYYRDVAVGPHQVVRAANHVFYTDSECQSVLSRCYPTYGNCRTCFRSGPIGSQCNRCRSDSQALQDRLQTTRYVLLRFPAARVSKMGHVDAEFLSSFVRAGHETAMIGSVWISLYAPEEPMYLSHSLLMRYRANLNILPSVAARAQLERTEMDSFLRALDIDPDVGNGWWEWHPNARRT